MKQFIKLLPILGVSVLTACSTTGVLRGNCNSFLVEEGASQYQYGPCTTDDYGYTSKFETTETVKVENPTVDTNSSSNPTTNTDSTTGSDSTDGAGSSNGNDHDGDSNDSGEDEMEFMESEFQV